MARNGVDEAVWAQQKGHGIKQRDPMSGATDDNRVDPETGDVYDPEGEYAGYLHDDYD